MATYYVDATTGDNGDTGLSEALAWATVHYAFSQITDGDHLHVKGGTDYQEQVTLVNYGLLGSPIVVEGYTTTPGDGGSFTIDGTGEDNCIALPAGSNIYYYFKNMILDGANYDNFNGASRYRMMFENCESNNSVSGKGFEIGGYCHMHRCRASDNGSDGFYMASNNRITYCEAWRNGGQGLRAASYNVTFFACLAVSNDDEGIAAPGGLVINCTVDGDNKDSTEGIECDDYSEICGTVLLNNIIYDCGVGIVGEATPTFQIGENNLVNNCTTDYSNWPSDLQESDITDAPGFETEGSDYTLASTSAARNAGADLSGTSSPGMDLGAYQSEDAGGGGDGQIVLTG
jgi:hypothetical protein